MLTSILSTKKYTDNGDLGTENAVVCNYYISDNLFILPIINSEISEHELNTNEELIYIPPIILVFDNPTKVSAKYFHVNKKIGEAQLVKELVDGEWQDSYGFKLFNTTHFVELDAYCDSIYFYLTDELNNVNKIEDNFIDDSFKHIDSIVLNDFPNAKKHDFVF